MKNRAMISKSLESKSGLKLISAIAHAIDGQCVVASFTNNDATNTWANQSINHLSISYLLAFTFNPRHCNIYACGAV